MPANDLRATHLFTIRDFIRWGASRMNESKVHFGHGTDNAIDEAAALVLHALHLPPDLHPEFFQAALTPTEKRTVLDFLERRIRERKPIAYLTNQAWFMDLPFYVDERVLVPRSPLAELIEKRFEPWLADPDEVTAILDLGTGSGCIGIACAYAFPEARIDLSDISEDALAVANRNIEDHGFNSRVRTVRSDLFADLGGRRYDIIVSNPPYVSAMEMEQLPPEYGYEPPLGLAAGEKGLDAVVTILQQAANHLKDQGILVVEVGNTQFALAECYPDAPFVWLDFERGGEGVFLLSVDQLKEGAHQFANPLAELIVDQDVDQAVDQAVDQDVDRDKTG